MQIRYALTQVTAPAKEPLAHDKVKFHLRVEDGEHDDMIDLQIVAARREAETFMGRSLITQTWDMDLDRFPVSIIDVPKPRLQSVENIKHVDTNGVLRTLDASGYRVDAKREPGRITPAYGATWPATLAVMNATVRFKAGYGDEAETVPADIRQALLLIVGRFYAHREDVRDGMPATKLPLDAQHLLRPYMIPRV